jgi:hypothetical protein
MLEFHDSADRGTVRSNDRITVLTHLLHLLQGDIPFVISEPALLT